MASRGSPDEQLTMTYYHFYVMQDGRMLQMCMHVMVRSWSMRPKDTKAIFHIVDTVPGISVHIYPYNL